MVILRRVGVVLGFTRSDLPHQHGEADGVGGSFLSLGSFRHGSNMAPRWRERHGLSTARNFKLRHYPEDAFAGAVDGISRVTTTARIRAGMPMAAVAMKNG